MLKLITDRINSTIPLERHFLWAFIYSLFFHLLAIFFSEGHHKLDEYGGVFAYTGSILNLWDTSFLNPGEYPAQIRPWFQPLLYSFGIAPYTIVGGKNPFVVNFFMRFMSSTIALYALFYFYHHIKFFLKNEVKQKAAIWMTALFWFFPYFHARTTAENLGTSFLLLAIPPIINSRKNLFYTGLFLVIAFYCRFQLSVMIFFLILWGLLNKKINIPSLGSGILAGITLMTIIDCFFYGEFSFTPWNYWKFNIIDGVASSIGESPWHYYFKKIFLKGIPPLSIIIYISSFFYFYKRPKDLITWLIIPFFIVHCLIGHKELRFLYPISSFLPLMIAYWLPLSWYKSLKLKILVGINMILLLVASVKPAFSAIGLYRFIWNNNIKEMFIVGDFPKPLHLYLRKQSILQEKIELTNLKNYPGWVFTNKYHFLVDIKKEANCKIKYSSYPLSIIEKIPHKYLKRSKVFSLFYCEARKP